MELLDLCLVAAGSLVLAIGSIAPRLQHWCAAEPLVAWLAGLAFGGVWIEHARPFEQGNVLQITEPFAQVTLVMGLVGAALRLPSNCFRKHWRAALVLLGPVMLTMWGISTLLAWLCLDLPIAVAAVVGACVSPTDPVLASNVVEGPVATRHLPHQIRELISMESGVNDGLAMLFVTLAMTWLGGASGSEVEHWLWSRVLWNVLGGVMTGLVAGGVIGYALKHMWKGECRPMQHLAFAIALSLLVLGFGGLVHMNGFLGSFIAVFVMNAIAPGGNEGKASDIQETLQLFLLLPVFAWLGAVAPYSDWWALGWGAAALAGSVLVLRRLPALLVFGRLSQPLRPLRRQLFIGWFGPIGIGAIFYAAHAVERSAPKVVWSATTLIVAASVVAHGVSATPLTDRYPPEET